MKSRYSNFCCPFNGNQANAKVGLRYSNFELTNSQIATKCEKETENISGDLSRDFAYAECVKREKDKRTEAATDTLSNVWNWLSKPKYPVVGPGLQPAEESKFPWGAVLGVTGGVAVIAGVIYYYKKNKTAKK